MTAQSEWAPRISDNLRFVSFRRRERQRREEEGFRTASRTRSRFRSLKSRQRSLGNRADAQTTPSIPSANFLDLFRKHHAVTARLPSDLHQGTIHIAHNRHDRHLFAWTVNFAASWVTHRCHKSRCIHGLSPDPTTNDSSVRREIGGRIIVRRFFTPLR